MRALGRVFAAVALLAGVARADESAVTPGLIEVVRPAPVEPHVAAGLAPGVAEAAPAGWRLRAGAREDYRLRSSEAASGVAADHDNDLVLSVDGSAESPAGRWSALVAASLWIDLDGNTGYPPPDPSSGLIDIHDAHDPWLTVFDLYVQYEGTGRLRLVRAGRQVTQYGPPVPFDGLYASVRPSPEKPLELFVLGGRGEHFYEVGRKAFEDWIVSAGLTTLLREDLRLEADYRFESELVEDDPARELAAPAGEYLTAPRRVRVEDNSYGLALVYRLGDLGRIRLAGRGIQSSVADLSALATLASAEGTAGIDLWAAVQPSTLGNLVESENPYFVTLGSSLPHYRLHADGWKSLALAALTLDAHLGYDLRQLIDHDPEPFNRNVARAYLAASVSRIQHVPGLALTLTVDRVGAGWIFGDRGEWALGGGLSYERSGLRGEVGTAYYAFRYDYYRDAREYTDERMVYADLRATVLGWLAVRARYEFEVFDRRLHTVTVGLSQAY